MKKNGFISVTVIYTFFLVFLSLMLYIVTNLVVNRNLLNNMKTTIKNELNDSNFNRYLINHCNDLIRMDDSYNNSIKDNSYRFVGSNPNNYVSINGNIFRIIGIFDGNVKLIANDIWQSMNFSSNNNIYSSSNIYSKINNDYLNEINISDYIENKVWYVGGIKDNVNANPKDIAINEVGENRNTGATATAKIGLPYISDYIYAGDASNKNTYGTVISKSNNWLYSSDLWFITRYNLSFTNVYYLGNNGSLILGNINDVRFVRPTFYLKKSTKIVSGDGTRSNPYQIG